MNLCGRECRCTHFCHNLYFSAKLLLFPEKHYFCTENMIIL